MMEKGGVRGGKGGEGKSLGRGSWFRFGFNGQVVDNNTFYSVLYRHRYIDFSLYGGAIHLHSQHLSFPPQ